MDRRAFKQRMQSLKSYRENNPGKGYWDWRNSLPDNLRNTDDSEYDMRSAYESGAQPVWNEYDQSYHLPTRDLRTGRYLKKSYHPSYWEGLAADIKEGYYPYTIGNDTYTRNPVTEQVFGNYEVEAFQEGGYTDDRTDHPIKKPTLLQEPIYRQYTIRDLGGKPDESWRKYNKDNDGQLSSEERLNRQKDEKRIEDWRNLGRGISNTFGTAAALASMISGGGWSLTRLLAGNRATQLGRSLAQLVLPANTADNVGDIIDFATEPTTSKAVEIGVGLGLGKWKDFGSTARQAAELGSQSLNATNTFTESFADGGETGDPEKERFYQATGRSSSGRPLEEGLKPVFSLEDAANMTPIGDAISAKDTYDAVKNRDWLGAGLAALTVLPFVPSGLRNVKATARYVPTVNRSEQNLINQAFDNINKKREYLSDVANSRNRVLEDINTVPYRNRAEQADKLFGTNYNEAYDVIDDLYQHRYFDLPEVQPRDMIASGMMQAKPSARKRFDQTGMGAEPDEFDLWVNTDTYRDPMQLANHEMNHYTDYVISRNPNTSVNNNMLKQLENSLKPTDARGYYRKGTEQKAYMNQLRTILKQNGEIQNLDEPVSSALLKKYLDKMPDSDPMKKMSKQHKNIKAYTKWFNAIPLLGTAALGTNAYFNNKENKQ